MIPSSPLEARDPPAGAEAPRLHAQGGHTEDITSVALSREGTHALTASLDSTARLWETETGRVVRVLRIATRTGGILTAAFTRDDKHVLTGSLDGVVRVWETATGKELPARALRGHSGAVAALAVSPGGTVVATASYDKTARLWAADTGKPLAVLQPGGTYAHTDRVHAVAFRGDGRVVVTGSKDGSAILWATDTGQSAIKLERSDAKAAVTTVAYAPDRKHVLVGYADGALLRFDASTQRVVQRLEGHTGKINALAIGASGPYVITGSKDGTARLFDVPSSKEVVTLDKGKAPVMAVALSQDGRLGAVASERSVRLWDTGRRQEVQRLEGHAERVLDIAVSPDGRLLAAAADSGVIHLWDLQLGRVVRRLRGHADAVGTIVFSPDGARLLSGAEAKDMRVLVWDTASGEPLTELTKHTQGAHAVAVSGDGTRYATGGCDNQVRVWRAGAVPSLVKELRGHKGNVEAVAVSSDGTQVLTGSIDTSVRLWRVETDETVWTYDGFEMAVGAVAFSPTDAGLVAAASQDGQVRILDRASGSVRQELKGLTDLRGLPVAVEDLAFSPDGTHVLVGASDNRARLWAVTPGAVSQAPLVLEDHTERVTSVAFTRDGKHLLTGSYDQTLQVHARATGTRLATLVAFNQGGWAVLDPDNRFDASDAGDVEGLHWIVPSDSIAGVESASLAQLKKRYYEPGLLQKAFGVNPEPRRAVSAFQTSELAPKVVSLQDDGGKLQIKLANRGGGIGKVVVQVNGKQVVADARKGAVDPDTDTLVIPVELGDDPRLIAGEANQIQVFAYDRSNAVRSRGASSSRPPRGKKADAALWAVIAGVSEYAGEDADLRYAAKDARDFHTALSLGAKELFTEAGTHVTLLEDATRPALLKALEGARKAKAGDVFVLYLAGHGATYKDEFHYLTAEASKAEVTDDTMRAAATVSSAELSAAINAIPAQKVVLILDTCASGGFVEHLTGQRGVPSSQRRALDRLKDSTGTHVIAGCAADRLSFENPRFGQGLLTYSLLLGMKGGPLREDQFVDVARLFGYAEDRVPELARQIGKEQNPVVARPKAGRTFDLGQLKGDARSRVPLGMPVPAITQSRFMDLEQGDDVQRLAARVDDALADASRPGKRAAFVFWNVKELADGYRIAGTYTMVDGGIKATFRLRRGSKEDVSDPITVTASLEQLPKKILERALEHLPAPK